ncbi:unnamed protein product [Didymodactylos carnosus]|uniref:Transposase n=1 Tax=Didymodactylos carnosus TaxID=1234261 RepID=A0A8S2YK46_9BILA|nr:unnamed protein product [Didymodactylos carnosus]
MESAASTLRAEHGKDTKIVICIDNASWHNRLTPDSEAPKRAWRKQLIVDCGVAGTGIQTLATKGVSSGQSGEEIRGGDRENTGETLCFKPH